MVGASVAMRPMTGVMITRLSAGNTVKVTANTVGIIAPPTKPCSARQTIISLIEPDMAHMKLMAVKPMADTVNRMRVDRMRDSMPESGIITTSAMR